MSARPKRRSLPGSAGSSAGSARAHSPGSISGLSYTQMLREREALSNSLDSDDSPADDAASVARLARLLEDGAVDDESMWRHQYACLDMDKLIAASQPPAPTEVLAAIAITASANPDSKGGSLGPSTGVGKGKSHNIPKAPVHPRAGARWR